MADSATLIAQLRVLEHLTRTEAQIARLRVGQARTDEVRRELAQNAENADARARRIQEALRELGGAPDVVAPALGRVTAFIKGAVEQGQTLDEALLGDLALEHQLLDRASYLRIVADAAQAPAVEQLADDLVTAHTATVEWLRAVLAEVAVGGPAALRPTPMQRVTEGVARAVWMPTRMAAESVNRAVAALLRAGDEVRTGAVGTVQDAFRAGREAVLDRAERGARAMGAAGAASLVHEARAGHPADGDETAATPADAGGTTAGTVDATAAPAPTAEPDVSTGPADPPIPGFAEMSARAAIAAIRTLGSADDARAVLAYEQAHGNRASVLTAARTRAAALDRGGA
jgi:hypothetical protein